MKKKEKEFTSEEKIELLVGYIKEKSGLTRDEFLNDFDEFSKEVIKEKEKATNPSFKDELLSAFGELNSNLTYIGETLYDLSAFIENYCNDEEDDSEDEEEEDNVEND